METMNIHSADNNKASNAQVPRIVAISHQPLIAAVDLIGLDMLAKLTITDRLWRKCTVDAQQSLLSDRHSLVRDAANRNLAASNSATSHNH